MVTHLSTIELIKVKNIGIKINGHSFEHNMINQSKNIRIKINAQELTTRELIKAKKISININGH